MWVWWTIFWDEWVPLVTRGESYAVIVNGDTTDGRHHGSTHQMSQNLSDQKKIALKCLEPVRDKCGKDEQGNPLFFMTRGTEAHVGPSGENEEDLALLLGAVPDEQGCRSRYELWLRLGGDNGRLVNIQHHIGTTGSMAYESTALAKEYTETCAEAGRWNLEAPAVVVRSHRHRCFKVEAPTEKGYGICITTPGWQLRTPFAYRLPGGRISTPQLGGILVRQGDEEMFTRSKVWNIQRTPVVVI